MSDAFWIAIVTTSGGVVSAVLLLVRRMLPPRKLTSGDVAMDQVWTEIRQLRTDLNAVVDERDEYRTTARILSDSNDALTAAVERTVPPIVFTPGEKQAIDLAKHRRAEDDRRWPTVGNPSTA